jgi:hypothetical protein
MIMPTMHELYNRFTALPPAVALTMGVSIYDDSHATKRLQRARLFAAIEQDLQAGEDTVSSGVFGTNAIIEAQGHLDAVVVDNLVKDMSVHLTGTTAEIEDEAVVFAAEETLARARMRSTDFDEIPAQARSWWADTGAAEFRAAATAFDERARREVEIANIGVVAMGYHVDQEQKTARACLSDSRRWRDADEQWRSALGGPVRQLTTMARDSYWRAADLFDRDATANGREVSQDRARICEARAVELGAYAKAINAAVELRAPSLESTVAGLRAAMPYQTESIITETQAGRWTRAASLETLSDLRPDFGTGTETSPQAPNVTATRDYMRSLGGLTALNQERAPQVAIAFEQHRHAARDGHRNQGLEAGAALRMEAYKQMSPDQREISRAWSNSAAPADCQARATTGVPPMPGLGGRAGSKAEGIRMQQRTVGITPVGDFPDPTGISVAGTSLPSTDSAGVQR